MDKMGEEGRKVQSSDYKINKSWGYNAAYMAWCISY